jgi:hypothetical protein
MISLLSWRLETTYKGQQNDAQIGFCMACGMDNSTLKIKEKNLTIVFKI